MQINPYYTSAIVLLLVLSASLVPIIGMSLASPLTANAALNNSVALMIKERLFITILTLFSIAALCYVFVSIVAGKH